MALRELTRIIDELRERFDVLSTRQRAQAIAEILRAVRRVARASIFPGTRAAKARILTYFQENVGVVIDSAELEAVSGIQDYPRRIRELRTEEGWPIISGVGLVRILTDNSEEDLDLGFEIPTDMRRDQYLLLVNTPDTDAARRWRLANGIRRKDVGTKEKLLEYLRANVGIPVTLEELTYVAQGRGDWPRRTRELRTQDGWPVVTRLSGDPTMPPGTYMLAEDRQGEIHDRNIPEPVRRNVMRRDGGRCRWRGCGWPYGFPSSDHRYLEVHHIEAHVDGGPNTEDNLITLCNLHHDEVHRTGHFDFSLITG